MALTQFFEKSIQGIQRLVVGFLCASLVAGQIIRFTVSGQGGGLLLSDIAVVLFLVVVFVSEAIWGACRPKLCDRRLEGRLSFLAITPFLLWSISTLILHSSNLQQSEILVALLYWVRLASIILLYPAGFVLFRRVDMRSFAQKAFVIMYACLLVIGFLQLFIFPKLEILGNNWDPHINRMVSTWLDPNFFGAFLAIALPTVVLWVPSRVMQILILALGSVAILLTKSRSTYVAAAVALCACFIVWLFTSSFPSKWKKLLLPGVITVAIFILFSGILLGERATKVFFHDPTINIRVVAYKEVWKRLVVPNIFFGVGYNAYQVVAIDAGLVANYQIHSRAGSDSSILTLLVTTGIIGTALFLMPILLGFLRHRSYVFIWATVFLLTHSLFVNSLLYPHILISSILVILLASK